jgi:hypothetical protein
MASSRDHERRLESVASAAKVVPEIEEDTVLPREMFMNQGTEGHKNDTRSDVHYYHDLAKRYRDQRDEARREALGTPRMPRTNLPPREIESENSKMGSLYCKTKQPHLLEGNRRQGRFRSEFDLLTAKNVDDYGPWRYAVDEKFDIDAPLFPNGRSKVRYALKMMKNPIFFGYADMDSRYPTSHL